MTVKQQRVPVPFIWGLYTGAGVHFFEHIEQVVEAIKDNDVIVGAHNGGKFDFHLRTPTTSLLDHLNQHEDMKIIDGRLVSAKIGRCEIRDTWNLFCEPLRSFASKLDIDYRKLEKRVRAKHMPEIKTYLAQDCVGLYDAVQSFEGEYGRHLTQAGAAMAHWKKISAAEVPKTDAKYFHRFQPFYYGGRVEVFEKGYIKGPIHVRDIRSAYARAMLDVHPYDVTYIGVDHPEWVEPQDMVTLDCVSNGCLPYRDIKGCITFPRDNLRRRFTVTGWEVLSGRDTGALRDVEILHAYRFAGRRDFGLYIHGLYERKLYCQRQSQQAHDAGDEKNTIYWYTQALFAKRLMNSLYGKFGANPDNYGNFMAVGWDEREVYEDEGYFFSGKLGSHAVVRRDLDPWQKHFINVATAASITGFVRAYLWRSLDGSDSPVYCDTDCIMARGFSADMPLGDDIGDWNHEGTAREAWFAGKKLYYLKGSFEKGKTEKMAAKGVRPDPKSIKRAALGEVVTMRSDAPTFTLKGGRKVYFQERRIRMTG